MKNLEFIENLKNYIKARYPLIFIETTEEDRLIADLKKMGTELNCHVTMWSPVEHFSCKTYQIDDEKSNLDFEDTVCECHNTMSETGEHFLFVFRNPLFTDNESKMLKIIAENIRTERKYRCNYIFVAPSFENMDNILSSEAVILDYPLLDQPEIKEKVLKMMQSWEKIYKDKVDIDKSATVIEKIANASLGLTSIEIENCLTRTLVTHKGKFSLENIIDIIKEKKQIIRKSGILEYIDNNLSLQDVGGLSILKRWLNLRQASFSEDAHNFGLESPKGVLLVGIPGCGKSLTAKCIASSWNMPLLRFDIGKIFSKWLGESEGNIRDALKTAEAIAPCILWIDEIEKGLQQDSEDGGTTKRIFGNILSWMQDKTAPVFVFATANNIRYLPPELLRKGRFDEIFFVDLPDFEERKKILEIHIGKLKRDIKNFDIDKLAQLSGETNLGSSIRLAGAEIEAWVKDSLLEAYSRKINGDKNADLSMNDFYTVLKRMIPMAKMRKKDFEELREWASENAVNASLEVNGNE